MSSHSDINSGPISVLWSHGMCTYSGSLRGCAFGVVGVSARSSGKYSKAVEKLAAVSAVSGIGDSSAGLSATCAFSCGRGAAIPTLKGL